MKKLFDIFAVLVVFFAMCVQFMGCGGVGAPPVTLPTPVTGRIVVSSPDASGNISVVGEDSSVTGSSTVMVINTNTAVSFYEKVLDLFVKDAYAVSSFPSVCSLTGRACTAADADGAFEVEIAGSEGDDIVVVLINSTTGAELSDRLTKETPSGVKPFVGGPVDLWVDSTNELLHILEKGGLDKDGNAITNRIRLFDISGGSFLPEGDPYEFGGTGAVQFSHDSNGGVAAMNVTSTAMTVYHSDSAMESFETLDVTTSSGGLPATVPATLFIGSEEIDYFLMTFDSPDSSFSFYQEWDLLDRMDIDLDNQYLYSSTLKLSKGSAASGVVLVSFVASFLVDGSDGNQTTQNFLGVYNELDITSWLTGERTPVPTPLSYIALPSGISVSDMRLIDGLNIIVISDYSNDRIYLYGVEESESNSGNPANAIVSLSLLSTLTYTGLTSPLKVDMIDHASYGYVLFAALEDGNTDRSDRVMTMTLDLEAGSDAQMITGATFTPVGLLPTAVEFYNGGEGYQYLFVSCRVSKNVTRLALEDIVPE